MNKFLLVVSILSFLSFSYGDLNWIDASNGLTYSLGRSYSPSKFSLGSFNRVYSTNADASLLWSKSCGEGAFAITVGNGNILVSRRVGNNFYLTTLDLNGDITSDKQVQQGGLSQQSEPSKKRADFTLNTNNRSFKKNRNVQDLFTNGDFEFNNFSGWEVYNQVNSDGSAQIVSNVVQPSPVSGYFLLSANTNGGNYFANTDENGPSSTILAQNFTYFGGSLDLSFDLSVDNDVSPVSYNDCIVDFTTREIQTVRVDLLKGSAVLSSLQTTDLVKNFYTLNTTSLSWTSFSFDLTPYVTTGQSYKIVFSQADNDYYQDMNVDNVHLMGTANDGAIQGDPVFMGFNGQRFEFDGEVGKIFNIYNDPWINLNGLFEDSKSKIGKGTVMTQFGLAIGGHNVIFSINADHNSDSYEIIVDGVVTKVNSVMTQLSGCVGIQYKDAFFITTPKHEIYITPKHGRSLHISIPYFNIHIHHPEEDNSKIGGVLGQTAVQSNKISVDKKDFEVSSLFSRAASKFNTVNMIEC